MFRDTGFCRVCSYSATHVRIPYVSNVLSSSGLMKVSCTRCIRMMIVHCVRLGPCWRQFPSGLRRGRGGSEGLVGTRWLVGGMCLFHVCSARSA